MSGVVGLAGSFSRPSFASFPPFALAHIVFACLGVTFLPNSRRLCLCHNTSGLLLCLPLCDSSSVSSLGFGFRLIVLSSCSARCSWSLRFPSCGANCGSCVFSCCSGLFWFFWLLLRNWSYVTTAPKVVHYFWPPLQESRSAKKTFWSSWFGFFLYGALLHTNVVLGFTQQHAERETLQKIGISGDHLAVPSQPQSFFTFFVLALAAHVA